mmetsp:Transcript_3002/g.6242  ORF Transcript_3002/g.6242 Transcript_3002/m.6242 type:complete len:510 (+) Transcript_3002:40-1569(+)
MAKIQGKRESMGRNCSEKVFNVVFLFVLVSVVGCLVVLMDGGGTRPVDSRSELGASGMLRKEETQQTATDKKNIDLPPITPDDVIEYFSKWLHELHDLFVEQKGKESTFIENWEGYFKLAERTIYRWDQEEYLKRMPKRRYDDSIFLSLASYRDENCLSTITNAFAKSKDSEKLFVGLVQQNCFEECRSGVLEDAKVIDIEPDPDCHKLFCESESGRPHCDAGRVRVLRVNETESLGPYAARFFASKLWGGEQWYMQIDSHMSFVQDWDATSVKMLETAPSKKPVISHYPASTENFEKQAKMKKPTSRLCGPAFCDPYNDCSVIRLDGAAVYDKKYLPTPRFSPFVAGGYFIANSDFLREVPFDPFLPWIFMGEEIIMSARLWTHGYDMFSPSENVVGHIYVRRHKPKFWETVHRVLGFGKYNPLSDFVVDRVKNLIKYPEAAADMLERKSILGHIEDYGMGSVRTVEQYLEMVGLDITKKIFYSETKWCEKGIPPPGFEEYDHLYSGN